jgi:hypothetical protein
MSEDTLSVVEFVDEYCHQNMSHQGGRLLNSIPYTFSDYFVSDKEKLEW